MIADVWAAIRWAGAWVKIVWYGALDLIAASYCSTQIEYWYKDPDTELTLKKHYVVGKSRGRELRFQSPRTGRFTVSYADIEQGIEKRSIEPLFRICLDLETANLEAAALQSALSAKRRAAIFLITFTTLVIFETVPRINFSLFS